jgi:hypothetical protein
MKPNVLLTTASLLSILFITFHLSDEIARGTEVGRLNMLIPMLVMALLVYGALALAGRRSGYIVMLIEAIFGTGIPIIHLTGAGLVGGKMIAPNSPGAFFWVWGNFVLFLISVLALILAVRCLWNPRWGQSRLFDSL